MNHALVTDERNRNWITE